MHETDHIHRARLYALASLAFDRPTDDRRGAIASAEFDDQLVASAAAVGAELGEHAERVVAERAAADALYSEYAALFGFEQGGKIPQYEIDHGPRTLVTSTGDLADIAGFYRAFGLEIRADERERVDHLCVELEFVSHLARQTAYLEEDGDETGVEVVTSAHADFLEDHLGRWLPAFRDAVHEEADSGFYPALADLVVALVDDDADRFDIDPRGFDEVPSSPLDGMYDEGGEFRCGTCGTAPAPPTEAMPMEDRRGPS